jgi:hypothetical protein
MEKLKLTIFILPVISLIVVTFFYLSILRKTTNKIVFRKMVIMTGLFALILNFGWELAQLPLYIGGSYTLMHISICALGSVADVIMVLLIYLALGLIYKNPLWVNEFTWQRKLVLIMIGGVGAVLGEMRHTGQGNWAYAPSMPLILILNVGLSPVLQFMILPLLVYYSSYYMVKNFFH